MNAPIRDLVVPGSLRVVVTESTYITIRCGRCGREFERCVHPYSRTASCRRCRRTCRIDPAAVAAEAAPNVTPPESRMTAVAELSKADHRRLLERLAEAEELDRLMRERGGLPSVHEPPPLHHAAATPPQEGNNHDGHDQQH